MTRKVDDLPQEERAEGVIKFSSHWLREPLSVNPDLMGALQHWRGVLRGRGWVGSLPDGTGFGNISLRSGEGGEGLFLITGSGTGGSAEISVDDLALVTEYSLEKNRLHCRGLTEASSESLSHAAIFGARRDVGAVIHIHSSTLWGRYLGTLPTTPADIEYGTPEMAAALQDLAAREELDRSGVAVMGGHRDGLMVYGEDLDTAGTRVLELELELEG
jgi:L-ribulose-5-phosphate 4-epimerase